MNMIPEIKLGSSFNIKTYGEFENAIEEVKNKHLYDIMKTDLFEEIEHEVREIINSALDNKVISVLNKQHVEVSATSAWNRLSKLEQEDVLSETDGVREANRLKSTISLIVHNDLIREK